MRTSVSRIATNVPTRRAKSKHDSLKEPPVFRVLLLLLILASPAFTRAGEPYVAFARRTGKASEDQAGTNSVHHRLVLHRRDGREPRV